MDFKENNLFQRKTEGLNEMNNLYDWKKFLTSNACNNSKNYDYASPVPTNCLSECCMLGVDEAGRGPVLGPMVYGVAYCPVDKKDLLQSLGCADSKALTEAKRNEILLNLFTKEESMQNVGWAADVISPSYISTSMNARARHSLNEVSMTSAIGLIKKVLEQGANITEIYVDTVGPPETYQAKLSEIFPSIKITVSKKADSLYAIVSAASIVAKVTRDHTLKLWQFKEGLEKNHSDFGSGYPGDPITKKFLSNNMDYIFGFPLLVRFSWMTAETILESKAATCTFDEEDEQTKPSGTRGIHSYFSQRNNERKRKKHKFFEERSIQMDNAFE